MLVAFATWALGAGFRRYYEDRQLTTDCCIFGVVAAWLSREQLADFLHKSWDASGATVGSSMVVFALITGPLAVLGLQSRHRSNNDRDVLEIAKNISKWTLQYPKAKIFPCETKHARMFPKRHAFEYSYLQCGFPIIPGGIDGDGHDVATGADEELGSWWLRIRAVDYLSRGNGKAGFYGKLQTFMRNQNVDDDDWSYAYLVTAPRFLGYSFNPVSFWYIYDREYQLKNMILEVNNTFGERRTYLLNGTSPSTPPQTPDSTREAETASEMPIGAKPWFTDLWMKDFHVSPFNSRKGSYVLKAQNPFPYAGYDRPMIDNTITLKSSKDHAKVVAHLNSVGTPVDPDDLGFLGAAWFILRWWWVGLVTFPRIVKEAGSLFYKRSLHVWFRPEVLTPSLGRLPTSQEVAIQQVFCDYLTHLVNSARDDFRIILHTTIPEIPTQNIECTRPPRGGAVKELEIRVLTPAFYSRFVHYAYTSEAFDRECIFTDEKNRTCWISRSELLAQILTQSASTPSRSTVRRGRLNEAKWLLLKKLRCAPAEPAYNATPKSPEFRLEHIRATKHSEMDSFVKNQRPEYAGDFRRTVTKLFLAQRFCLGFPQVITLMDWALRISLCYFAATQVSNPNSSGRNVFLEDDWWPLSGSIAAATACHAYGLLKGYC
ncbi:uncharacterized protein M421DRAFT_341490 [Didymella exigua CBS 183.55]|uniref:DUF1365-domain-containing protein n=1 Tax=Didymella exigua CBS 183.55 TaxID=1150837 RepID=A0A6A5RY03_9PLEO|nr:uncharacterized protein M421DRAFT_341490 [Didymella exigua CBS 183.55]KAF1931176.1 hypothetical protein M421DRAFT_341490 [Didymella exigua CBS 183.55]